MNNRVLAEISQSIDEFVEHRKLLLEEAVGIKECNHCGRDFPFTKEHFCITKQELKKTCKTCLKEKVEQGRQEKRSFWRSLLHKRKQDFCSKCGYNRCFSALEFHHIDPSKKKYNISTLYLKYPAGLILEELDKCICLCANCHRELHAEKGKENT